MDEDIRGSAIKQFNKTELGLLYPEDKNREIWVLGYIQGVNQKITLKERIILNYGKSKVCETADKLNCTPAYVSQIFKELRQNEEL